MASTASSSPRKKMKPTNGAGASEHSSPQPPALAAAKAELQSLEQWLRTQYPCDVLIPCPIGEKRPRFRYGGGGSDAWTWDKFDSVRAHSVGTPSEHALIDPRFVPRAAVCRVSVGVRRLGHRSSRRTSRP